MSSNVTNPRVAIIVQARMGSTRFPGKILKEIVGAETVLGYLLKRLSSSKHANKIIVATTTNPKDNVLESWLKKNGYLFYRGNEDDCLDRFYQICAYYNVDIAVRITSDCPLVVPEVVDDMIFYYLNNYHEIDYLSNRQYTNFPEGIDVEIFSTKILTEAAENAVLKKEREHINYYFLNRDTQYRVRYYNHNLGFDYSRFKLSIDTYEDIERVRSLFKEKGLPLDFSLLQLIGVLQTEEQREQL
ncbi:MAG: acylneuraminate cytidylyltransferase [Planctomycetes bacterium]|nr:acylneuraminate cytidylyltransferase [Planctomycetota bacterium]